MSSLQHVTVSAAMVRNLFGTPDRVLRRKGGFAGSRMECKEDERRAFPVGESVGSQGVRVLSGQRLSLGHHFADLRVYPSVAPMDFYASGPTPTASLGSNSAPTSFPSRETGIGRGPHRCSMNPEMGMRRAAPALQPKLTVGAIDDPLEHEADRVADEILSAQGEGASEARRGAAERPSKCGLPPQQDNKVVLRRNGAPSPSAPTAPPAVHAVLREPGMPLDPTTRGFFEPRLGRDLGGVRIHTGSTAAASASSVRALAYTVGSDIVFGEGQYAPGAQAGRRMLAHELAHVLQQGGAGVLRRFPPDSKFDTPETKRLLREAAAAERKAEKEANVADSLAMAKSLATKYPGWLNVLPACPCTDAEARSSSDWSGPGACLPPYHIGAASGYRSSRGYSSIPGTNHGQQCCYDAKGLLITAGAGAGTPDIVQAPAGVGAAVGGTLMFWRKDRPGALAAYRHYQMDVVPFNHLGWQVYNRYWVPNNAKNCPSNKIP